MGRVRVDLVIELDRNRFFERTSTKCSLRAPLGKEVSRQRRKTDILRFFVVDCEHDPVEILEQNPLVMAQLFPLMFELQPCCGCRNRTPPNNPVALFLQDDLNPLGVCEVVVQDLFTSRNLHALFEHRFRSGRGLVIAVPGVGRQCFHALHRSGHGDQNVPHPIWVLDVVPRRKNRLRKVVPSHGVIGPRNRSGFRHGTDRHFFTVRAVVRFGIGPSCLLNSGRHDTRNEELDQAKLLILVFVETRRVVIERFDIVVVRYARVPVVSLIQTLLVLQPVGLCSRR